MIVMPILSLTGTVPVSVLIEALAGIDTGLALINLLLQEFADAVLDGAFFFGGRLHLVDVVRGLEADDIEDLERACGRACRELPCEVDRLGIGDAVRPEALRGA